MKRIVMSLDKNISAGELYKSINIKDVIIYTKQAWDDVTSTIIKNCWNKAGYNFDNVDVEDSIIQIENYAVFCKKMDILDLVKQDKLFKNILDHNDFILGEADDVILSEKINDNEVDEIIKEVEEVKEVKIKKDLKETIKNFYELKEYLLKSSRPSEEGIKSLKTIENTLAVKHNGPTVQF
ncbi:hypothetical protein CDIK_2929 [Cucumispora dikerogammari]|nr:hypothetical protein CDIK_2929 [Cucumispora dikerogammari]